MKMISRNAVFRLLDKDGIVFRKTIEELPTVELHMCKDCKHASKAGECLLLYGPQLVCLSSMARMERADADDDA